MLALLALTVLFIFFQSAQPTQTSSQSSSQVAQSITNAVTDDGATALNGFWKFLVRYVRKAAHVAEFCLLGTELAVLVLLLRPRRSLPALWNALSGALAIAVADETIQIFSGRGPRVQDVLLDMGGALTAIGLVWLLYTLIRWLWGKRH